MPEIEPLPEEPPRSNDPKKDAFFQAMQGGSNWVKDFVSQVPEKGTRPRTALKLAECVRGAYMDKAVSPAFSLTSVRKTEGCTYWYVQPENERILSPNVFAPSVHSKAMRAKMHFAATVGNLRTLLHSIVGVVMETIEAQAMVANNQIDRDVHLYLDTIGGAHLKPSTTVLGPASRPVWQENVVVVEKGDDKPAPKPLYTPGHLTLWCQSDDKRWLEMDLCHFKGIQLQWHAAPPAQSVPVYEAMVQSRLVVEKYRSSLQPVLDTMVGRIHAWVQPPVVVNKKKKRKKKRKKKKNLAPINKVDDAPFDHDATMVPSDAL